MLKDFHDGRAPLVAHSNGPHDIRLLGFADIAPGPVASSGDLFLAYIEQCGDVRSGPIAAVETQAVALPRPRAARVPSSVCSRRHAETVGN